MAEPSSLKAVKASFVERAASFWPQLVELARSSPFVDQLVTLETLRKRALGEAAALLPTPSSRLRVAIVGAHTLEPLSSLLELFSAIEGVELELWRAEFGADLQQILDPKSALQAQAPELVIWLPDPATCRYAGSLRDERERVDAAAVSLASELLAHCQGLHERLQCEVLLGNFALPAHCDLGPLRGRSLASEWSYKKRVNLELGLTAPSFVHVCDVEFLTHRMGAQAAEDARGWFESKQPGSPELLVALARELARRICALRRPAKKVLVLDLDDTLWGGVLGEDGLEGIELGTTSPRGEAYKALQRYARALAQRGVLLAVCSKNDEALALSAFDEHPEMVLRRADIACFKANWQPKSKNLAAIAEELGLGVSSLVFVDDNAAEIELVRQQLPDVSCVLLGSDPADHVAQLQDSRLFEVEGLTVEDEQRSQQYQSERERRELRQTFADLSEYWASLRMEASFQELTEVDVLRVAQLVGKSNQFNVTSRRRSQAEVSALMHSRDYLTCTVRLRDRFGDHGLVGVVFLQQRSTALEVDTWLMSCRVLQRQLEHETLNEVVRLARLRGCDSIRARYLPTPKNALVRELFPELGFATTGPHEYLLSIAQLAAQRTQIQVTRRCHEGS